MPRSKGRTGRPWLRARAWVIRYYLCPVHEERHCGICHEDVDLTLSGRHRDGPTADHIRKLEDGGALHDPANLRLAHLRCNTARENTIRGQRRQQAATVTPATGSRDW